MISIIIPTRNRIEYLKRCLAALKNQTYKNFEVLVCDDGGQKKADKIVNSSKINLNIQYIWIKNKGGMSPASVRNVGWKNAKGKFLLFLDCDIILPPKSIEMLFAWITKYDYRKHLFHVTPLERIQINKDIPLKIINNKLKEIQEYIEKDEDGKICKGDLSISTVGLFNKEIIDKIGGFDDILFVGRIYEDIELGARLFGFFDNKRKILPFKVYHLNHYSEFSSRDIKARKKLNVTKSLIQKKFELLGFKYSRKYRPEKDFDNFTNKHYIHLLNNKDIINKISMKLYNQAKNEKSED